MPKSRRCGIGTATGLAPGLYSLNACELLPGLVNFEIAVVWFSILQDNDNFLKRQKNNKVKVMEAHL